MNTKTLFTGRAEDYVRGRPTYAEALLDFLCRDLGLGPGRRVADVGAGTGIFSRQLVARGCAVVCVEPNGEMLAAARSALAGCPGVTFADASAEDTGLPDGSLDFITAAQAFHWFDTPRFKAESHRILRPEGLTLLIWNFRDTETPFGAAYQEIFKTFCPAYKGFSGGLQKDDPRIRQYFDGGYDYAAFDHPILYDRAAFLSRALSSSYSLGPGDPRYGDYLRQLELLFEAHAVEGLLTVANQSALYWGRP